MLMCRNPNSMRHRRITLLALHRLCTSMPVNPLLNRRMSCIGSETSGLDGSSFSDPTFGSPVHAPPTGLVQQQGFSALNRVRLLTVSHHCLKALSWWKQPAHLCLGVALGSVTRREVVKMDTRQGLAGDTCLGTPVTDATVIWLPLVTMLLLCLEKIRQDRAKVFLLPSYFPSRLWFSALMQLLIGQTWRLPKRHDLLSQARGTLWHLDPSSLQLWVWPLNGCI
ncbi:UNVERIFIED_CONTAM: hypothetical protein FKN15_006952 [Acipenser sinensis]